MENNSKEGETNFSSLPEVDRKPFVHPLLLVVIFLLLLVVFAVFGLYTSLKEKTRPKPNTGINTTSNLTDK